MARLNVAPEAPAITTHEGAAAKRINPEQQLRRLVMACMLWEDTFYVDGRTVADQIKEAVELLDVDVVCKIAIEARTAQKLRHVPLLIARQLARSTPDRRVHVAGLLEAIIQRPDELAEFLAIYWADGRQPLSSQVKKGLARAFSKFDEHSLSKYDREGAVRLRDVLFLSHAKPFGPEREELYKKVVERKLATPDTWEVALSGGADKKETFERMLRENSLGALAMLRNLRNMKEAKVDDALIRSGIVGMKTERVLPFRFISAARYAPQFEPELEQAMFKCLEGREKLAGRTALVIDKSGSMFHANVSEKSELNRFEAACALAILLREACEKVNIYGFSDAAWPVPPRRGFGLRDALVHTGAVGNTNTENGKQLADADGYDRIIILTDEQSHQTISAPKGEGWVVNVGTYQNGIGYGTWNHVDGWSEAILDFIQAVQAEG